MPTIMRKASGAAGTVSEALDGLVQNRDRHTDTPTHSRTLRDHTGHDVRMWSASGLSGLPVI